MRLKAKLLVIAILACWTISGCANDNNKSTTDDDQTFESTSVISESDTTSVLNESESTLQEPEMTEADNINFIKANQSPISYEPKSVTREELEQIWSVGELYGGGKLFYPGFSLGVATVEGSDNAMLTDLDRGIAIIGLDDPEFLIDNGTTTAIETDSYSILDKEAWKGQILGERIFYYDLTGDGKEELIFKSMAVDMGFLQQRISVYDIETLDKIEIPSDIISQMGDFISVQIDEYKDNTLYYSISDGDGTKVQETLKTNITSVDDIEVAPDCDMHYYTFIKDGTIYCVQTIAFYNKVSMTYESSECRIVSPLQYDEATKSFVLSDEYEIYDGDAASDDVIDKELESTAYYELDEYCNKYGKSTSIYE